jgi:hypothetical protein
MRLARQLALLGFVIGLGGPIAFYDTTPPFFPNGSHLVCPWCPPPASFPESVVWMSLKLGLMSGVAFAVIGYAAGFLLSKLRS